MNDDALNFAFGSNLDLDRDWEGFCREHGFGKGLLVPRGPAILPDFELAFTKYSPKRQGGVLDIQPRVGCITPGMLFEVRGRGWSALDAKEGAPDTYRRRAVTVLTAANEAVRAVAYQVSKSEGFVNASTSYVEVVRRGLAAFGLDDGPLWDAVSNRPAGRLDAVFVYGTLMRAEPRYPALGADGAKSILLARARGRLLKLGSFPGLLQQGDATVSGEIMRFPNIEPVLRKVDRIEGFAGLGAQSNLYRRIILEADTGDGRLQSAWAYEYQGGASGREIDSGCWRLETGTRRETLNKVVLGHGDPETLLKGIAERRSLPPAELEAFKERNSPLWAALAEGRLGERDLAQVSGRWAVQIR